MISVKTLAFISAIFQILVVPWGGAYGVFMSQLVRYCDTNSNIDSFCKDVTVMVDKLVKQGFLYENLFNTFLKFSVKYLYKWSKFGTDALSKMCRIYNS